VTSISGAKRGQECNPGAGVRDVEEQATTFPPQPFGAPEEARHPEENGHGVTEEDSPELGQTEQVVADAMRRVDSE
jgi:hypothetical protein